ncbi:MAG: helix-turn-helix domain-containing protein, partial [Noviherbaspirillum sp.]
AEPLQALSPSFVMKVAPELGLSPEAILLPERVAPPLSESIEQVLARFDGNREAAAKYLGISRTTLWRKLNRTA